MERATGRYSIEAGDPRRDEDEIVRLCSIELPGFTRPHYGKYFFENPLGPPALVVARHADDGLVGVAALHPTSFVVGGSPCLAAVAGNFAVDRRHRAFGPALALQRSLLDLARERGWTFLLGLPNAQSEGVFTRVGYTEVGRFTRSVRLLSVRETLASMKERSGAGTRELAHALARGRVARAVRGWSVSTPAAFGVELEPAWAATTTQASIIPLRTPELLEWKYERLLPPVRLLVDDRLSGRPGRCVLGVPRQLERQASRRPLLARPERSDGNPGGGDRAKRSRALVGRRPASSRR